MGAAAPPGLPAGAFAARAVSVVRYRFFLYAGLLPYLLGAAWARGMEGAFEPRLFWLGLLGVALAVAGVECFNEYYDARLGTDRVFDPDADERVPEWTRPAGIAAFTLAAAVGLLLARERGWPVLLYAALGGAAAVGYVGPPFRWVYRGLGEAVIGLSYGPWMTLGSAYLHTARFSWGALVASWVPGLLIMSLAVVNNIPDYHQDRLVGKRTLVVRLGRRGGRLLYLGLSALGLLTAAGGAAAGAFPPAAALAAASGAPLWEASRRAGARTWDTPRLFLPAVRRIIQCYAAATAVFALALAFGR